MTHGIGSESIHHSVKEFRIIYDKLIAMGLSRQEIEMSSNLAYATVTTLISDQVPRIRASTLGKLQEFIKGYNTQTLTNRKFQKFLREGDHKNISVPEGVQRDYGSRVDDKGEIKEKEKETMNGQYAEERRKEEEEFFTLLKKLYKVMPEDITIKIEMNAS